MKLFSTNTEYETWLINNKETAMKYIKDNDIALSELQLTAQTHTLLRINQKYYLSDIIFLSASEIEGMKPMTAEASCEILMLKKNFLRKHKNLYLDFISKEAGSDCFESAENYKSSKKRSYTSKANAKIYANDAKSAAQKILLSDEYKAKAKEFADYKNITIDHLNPSVRTYNSLRRGLVRTLSDALDYYPDGFNSFKNLGKKSVKEIKSLIENYISENADSIWAYINGDGKSIEEIYAGSSIDESNPYNFSSIELISHPLFQDKARQYISENNISVEHMGLNNRATNALINAGILSLSDAVSIYPNDLYTLKNIGNLSTEEIKGRLAFYLDEMQDSLRAYCSGNTTSLYSNDFIESKIISCFENAGLSGITSEQIREALSEQVNEDKIEECLKKLLDDNKIELIDSKFYKVYESIFSAIESSHLKQDAIDVLLLRFGGMTLEEIAQKYGLTRERIRQKIDNSLKTLKREQFAKCGFAYFKEDYHNYLYSNYEFIKEFWIEYMQVSDKTLGYLAATQKKGKTPIGDALADQNVTSFEKLCIIEYGNKDTVVIDGVRLNRLRAIVEDFAISKLCIEDTTYDEFIKRYNELLRANHLEKDEQLYYKKEQHRTRSNRLAESMCCLWKLGEKIRYYDIEGQDFTELLQTLNLGRFKNTEISTLKFIEDYPDIMKKYDIRDQYELHNLLRKIVRTDQYNDIRFNRQPMIQFGEFDRTAMLRSLLEVIAPVTSDEFADQIHAEYGYDKATIISTFLQPLSQFYYQGVYNIDFKRIPDERINILKARLTEDFYYIAEIKKLYKELFSDADADEINPLSLKAMGFTVFTTYVLQNYPSAEAYFTNVLTSNDIYDISAINKRFLSLKAYYCVYFALRKNCDIFLLDKTRAITINKLNELGITKEDIYSFCEEVANFVNIGEYFTIHSLRKAGFTSKLDALGFDNTFYAGILAANSRFSWQHVFGEIVLSLKATNGVEIFSKGDFLRYTLSKYESIKLDDFISDFYNDYGIIVTDRYDITRATSGTNMCYFLETKTIQKV